MNSLAKKIPNLDLTKINQIFALCYIAGYFGARILSIFVDEGAGSVGDFFTKLVTLGPMTFYGGAIGSAVVGILYSFKTKMALKDILDIAMPAGLVALAVGRIGCFLNGDDFGIPTTLQGDDAPWYGVVFPNLQDGLSRIPVQLISTITVGAFALYLILNFSRFRSKFGYGFIGIVSVWGYSILRFFIEFMRGDTRGYVYIESISTSQFISINLFIISGVFLASHFKKAHS